MPRWTAYLQAHRQRFLEELVSFLRIPSISGEAAHQADLAQAARWVARRLQQAGVPRVEMLRAGESPVVFGEYGGEPGRPTVLIYGHFDVEPVGDLTDWVHPPFAPVVTGGCMYARGASDDKGNMLIPILAAEALLQCAGRLPVNLKFLFEGQEEVGSPDLPAFIAAQRNRLKCDVVLSADGGQYGADLPALIMSSRGYCALQIDVTGPATDLHSGVFGGTVQNPIHALVRLLDSMRRPDGAVAVAGFYDDVAELTALERQRIAAVPFSAAAYEEQVGAGTVFGEPGYSTLERCWARPSLEVNGIWGGSTGEGVQAIVPRTAHAKLTCRLVSGQTPDRVLDLLEQHVALHTPSHVQAKLRRLGGACRPYRMDDKHPANQRAHEVLAEVYGCDPVYVGTGASVPVYTMFQDLLGVDTVTFGFGCDDENIHAPNEFLRLKNWDRGQMAYCRLIEELGR
ncbi:MAG TPA: dipeptidase [Symbiobacteriaceae bacterium]|nr:dipeptidase [Symbiobacteriaceae bacterium]